ncbi:antiviral reverse transcriptase Drt3a [Actomonas aquatica]|uniref:Antiviral reverse transcriptase Drt3a n=1 Tax=Actomonas aquatica TaxID=2866162 RepID=A0ABZ1CFB8_9BACT|nr:antiviral reverse transcriptase Drt3a [Opitutus sp. WL0086]WRQ89992.1 antiviral reverse transcriptase Drt3a [Opitutus sp. WL0086]
MLQQTLGPDSLLKVISRNDVQRWDLWSRSSEIDSVMRSMFLALEKSSFRIDGISMSSHNGNTTIKLNQAKDHFGLKLIDRHLRRIYKVVQSDRNRIIREIRALLGDGGQLSIIREDVRAFYESIRFEKLIEKLRSDMLLSNRSLSMIESLNGKLLENGNSGLPRGIALSATLSELYMEPFDRAIQAMPCTFYFARYVDDIVVLTDSESVNDVKHFIAEELQKLELELRNDGTRSLVCDVRSADFSYLGYHFKTVSTGSNAPKVIISISKNKINKVKRRIIKSFIAFENDGDFSTLLARCRYLSCSKIVKKSDTGDVLSGLKYNYRYISSLEKLKVFDGFMNKILSGGTRFGSRLTADQRDRLRRISFYRASRDGTVVSYTRRKVNRLKQAWSDE